MAPLPGMLLFLATVAMMEGVAYAAHRWVMHGPGWFLHASHHRARTGNWELNDLYAVIFAMPSIVLLFGGVRLGWWPGCAWIGAGIDLARTGQLTNHAMDGWLAGFGTDKFYVQPPFGAYTLALWVLLFGVSNAGFLVFAWLWYGVGGWGLWRVLRRFGLPAGMRLLLLLIYLNLLIGSGLRPEPEMFGLMFLGLSLLDAAAPFWQRTAAFVLLGLAGLTYPLAVAVAVPFGIALWRLQVAEGTTASAAWRVWLPPILLAGAIVLGAFLAMIHGELRTFWTVLNAHRLLRAEPGGVLPNYLGFLTRYQEMFFSLPTNLLLLVAAGYVAVRWRHTEPRVRLWVAASVAAAVVSVALYVVRALDVIVLVAFAAACTVVSQWRFRPHRWKIVLCLGSFYLWTQALWLVSATMRRFPDPARLRSVREEALRSGKPLVVDSSTARYVFHYDLPAGTLHGEYVAPWDSTEQATVRENRARNYWVVTLGTMEMQQYALPLDHHNQYVTVGHHEFHSAPLCPDEPLVNPPTQ